MPDALKIPYASRAMNKTKTKWIEIKIDHMTAAERAEHLRVHAPRTLAEVAPGLELPISMSIGIASRPAGSAESIESVMRRADMAMYAVKRGGRGHWRVSHQAAL